VPAEGLAGETAFFSRLEMFSARDKGLFAIHRKI
jgi:hypothetical protein